MKVVVVISKHVIKRRYLVELQGDVLVQEVAALIGRKEYSKAASVILDKGRIEREISKEELGDVDADLIIEGGPK